MPRRVQVVSPSLILNERLVVRFDNGTSLLIKLTAAGYEVKGGIPVFQTTSKTELDKNLSIIAEDRGGLDKFTKY
jgi:hypothetical protein